jgi:hypothetical protein
MFSGTEGFVLAVVIIATFLPLLVIGLVVVVNNRLPGRRRARASAPQVPAAPLPDRAGWFADPAGRHQQRYWDGTGWTDAVVTDGKPGTDPL